jgi:hypothetical protein
MHLKHERWVYYLPIIHLCACFVAVAGFLVHGMVAATLIIEYSMFFDFPVSVVTFALAFKHGSLAMIWMFVAGTLWWYLLACGIERLINKSKPLGA